MRLSHKSQGFVLKKNSLLNKDLILTIFTENFGKIKIFAHGIKKITSRRLSSVQTGNMINLVLDRKQDRFYLKEINLISGFSDIKSAPEKLKGLYTFLFLMDKILPENQKEEELFLLVKKFLIELTKSDEAFFIVNKYLNLTMISLGYLKEKKSDTNELLAFIEEIINEKVPRFNI